MQGCPQRAGPSHTRLTSTDGRVKIPPKRRLGECAADVCGGVGGGVAHSGHQGGKRQCQQVYRPRGIRLRPGALGSFTAPTFLLGILPVWGKCSSWGLVFLFFCGPSAGKWGCFGVFYGAKRVEATWVVWGGASGFFSSRWRWQKRSSGHSQSTGDACVMLKTGGGEEDFALSLTFGGCLIIERSSFPSRTTPETGDSHKN